MGVLMEAFSLTLIRTGFLKPALTRSCNSLVCVAEKRPVRRCRGRYCRIVLSVAVKPRSRSLSASSRTRNSCK